MLGQLARAGRPRIVAALLRRFGPGELDLVEGAVQEAMLRALERWPREGVPARAEGWLVRVAHNVAIDLLRRRASTVALGDALGTAPGAVASAAPDDAAAAPIGEPPRAPPVSGALRGASAAPGELADAASPDAAGPPAVDDQLCLMFLCCHPALSRAAQVALTLKIACGFSTQQIALAFLTDEATLAQRVVRAKQQLRRARPVFELPGADELPARLEPILDVLYLVFGEGHSPSDGDAAIKQELCDEALRLARIVAPLSPAASALCALCCFQASRATARTADDGSLLLLPEQDRERWDRDLIALGFAHLAQAAHGAELSRFHLEAGIAACHAAAPSHAATDWASIAQLYDLLHARAPSPVVDVNRAIAIAMLSGAQAGLDELDAIPERELIERYPYALAAYAELHASLGELDRARGYLDRALAHQPSRIQRALLERKRAALAR